MYVIHAEFFKIVSLFAPERLREKIEEIYKSQYFNEAYIKSFDDCSKEIIEWVIETREKNTFCSFLFESFLSLRLINPVKFLSNKMEDLSIAKTDAYFGRIENCVYRFSEKLDLSRGSSAFYSLATSVTNKMYYPSMGYFREFFYDYIIIYLKKNIYLKIEESPDEYKRFSLVKEYASLGATGQWDYGYETKSIIDALKELKQSFRVPVQDISLIHAWAIVKKENVVFWGFERRFPSSQQNGHQVYLSQKFMYGNANRIHNILHTGGAGGWRYYTFLKEPDVFSI